MSFKLSFTLFISSVVLSSAALAHLSLKGEATADPKTTHHWTGYYGGFNAGLVNHTTNITDNQATTFNATLQQVTNPKITGGFQLGYRRQLDVARTSGLYGVEFSTNFANVEFSKNYGSPFALYHINSENKLQTVCLLQLMGGIAADRTLLFLAAGVAWAKIEGTITNLDSIGFFSSFNTGQNVWGTALGGGMEYALNDRLSARFKLDVITPNTYTVANGTGGNFQIANSIVEATFGLNYKIA